MSERGEASLFGVLLLATMTGIILLCSMELHRSYALLTRRTKIFLCAKETKIHLNQHLLLMGRTNWAIRNIDRVKLVMMLFPGLQAGAFKAAKVKAYLQYSQTVVLISYLKSLATLKKKDCPIDPRLFITPYKIRGAVHQRDKNGAAILRKNEWDYQLVLFPYALKLSVEGTDIESMKPKPRITVTESVEKLSSLFSSVQ